MIIGIDAGALSIEDKRLKVGVWRVTYNLFKELAGIDQKNEYRLYTFAPIGERFGKNFKNIVVKPKIGWSTLQLPLELWRHPVDVFLGVSQMIPFAKSYNIGFVHDLGFLHYPQLYPGSVSKLKSITKNLISKSNHIVTFSYSTKKDINKLYGQKKPISVVYEGVDHIFGMKGSKFKRANPYILVVGALKRGKNIPKAIKIFERFLKKSKKSFDLVIVGGSYWEDPEINLLGKRKHIYFKGFVTDKQLASYYRGAYALLITSLWEGYCLPAVEAIASGCPVIYHDAGSLKEIVGKNGLSFKTEEEAVRALLSPKKPKIRRHLWRDFAYSIYRLYENRSS